MPSSATPLRCGGMCEIKDGEHRQIAMPFGLIGVSIQRVR
jgi:hypothetical protein